jgi:hypothetical protein
MYSEPFCFDWLYDTIPENDAPNVRFNHIIIYSKRISTLINTVNNTANNISDILQKDKKSNDKINIKNDLK